MEQRKQVDEHQPLVNMTNKNREIFLSQLHDIYYSDKASMRFKVTRMLDAVNDYATKDPAFNSFWKKFLRQLKGYVVDVGMLKIGLAVTYWTVTAYCIDKLAFEDGYPAPNSFKALGENLINPTVLLRNVGVAFGGMAGAKQGSEFADWTNLLVDGAPDANFSRTQFQLSYLVLIIDFLWQYWADLVKALTNVETGEQNAIWPQIIQAFVFYTLSGLLWHGVAKLTNTKWNDVIISAQIVACGFFFFIPGLINPDMSLGEQVGYNVLATTTSAATVGAVGFFARALYRSCQGEGSIQQQVKEKPAVLDGADQQTPTSLIKNPGWQPNE